VRPPGDILDAVRSLRLLTNAQVEAARTLKVADLEALNARRTTALFDLRTSLAERLPPADPALREEVVRLAAAEARLSTVAGWVLDAVGRLDPHGRARTYDAAGRVG
jgi:hypothetical protein